MAITITVAEVKRKCRIPGSDTTYDSDIQALIAEMQPGLEYGIADEYLNDSENSGLQAVLKLGMLEIIGGEFLSQLLREAGASEEFRIAGLALGARADHGAKLKEQGCARLRPFQKAHAELLEPMQILTTAEGNGRAFTEDDMRNW